MIGTFGPVTFEANDSVLRTFSGLRRSGSARLATHETVRGRPLTEFIGPGLDAVTFSMRLDAAQGLNPRREIESLRELRDKGLYYPLVLGGKPLGTYLIEQLEEDWQRVDHRGLLLLAVAAVTLRECVGRA